MGRKIEVGEIAKNTRGHLFRIAEIHSGCFRAEGGFYYKPWSLAELSDVKTADEAALFVGRWVRSVQHPGHTYWIAHAGLTSWELDGEGRESATFPWMYHFAYGGDISKYVILLPLSYSPEKPDTDSDPVLYGTAGATAAEAARRVAYSKQKAEEKAVPVSGGNAYGDISRNLTHIYDGKDWRTLPACDCGKREGEHHAETCIRMLAVMGFGWWYCNCGAMLAPRETRCMNCRREKSEPEEKPVPAHPCIGLGKIESTEGTAEQFKYPKLIVLGPDGAATQGPGGDLVIWPGPDSPDPHCPECRCDTRCEAHGHGCNKWSPGKLPYMRRPKPALLSDRPFSLAYARWFCEEHARWLMI